MDLALSLGETPKPFTFLDKSQKIAGNDIWFCVTSAEVKTRGKVSSDSDLPIQLDLMPFSYVPRSQTSFDKLYFPWLNENMVVELGNVIRRIREVEEIEEAMWISSLNSTVSSFQMEELGFSIFRWRRGLGCNYDKGGLEYIDSVDRIWVLEYKDHGKELKISDLSYNLKPRPLISMSISTPKLPIPCSCCVHNPNIFERNQHLMTDYQVKKDTSTEPAVSRSRWNPTFQQLQALEEIYRRGIRTPSAEQIQEIAAKLRRFGKIEEKNVFYWFQNHKARERQKKRRHLESLSRAKIHGVHTLEANHTGFSKRDWGIEHAKKLATPSDCSKLSEDSVAIHQRELHQTAAENQETWPLDLYSFMPPNKKITTKENSKPFGDLKLSMSLLPSKNDDLINILENEGEENLTLELFPIWTNDQNLDVTAEDMGVSSLKNIITPNEFFEFLPPKN